MRGPQRGFTLLEVMVALAVLAIALTAIIRGGSANAANATHLQLRSLGHIVAMNRVAELQLAAEWPAIAERRGEVEMAHQQWRWESRVEATPDPALRRLTVRAGLAADEGWGDTVVAFLARRAAPTVATP